jgi:hypothetical protein
MILGQWRFPWTLIKLTPMFGSVIPEPTIDQTESIPHPLFDGENARVGSLLFKTQQASITLLVMLSIQNPIIILFYFISSCITRNCKTSNSPTNHSFWIIQKCFIVKDHINEIMRLDRHVQVNNCHIWMITINHH